MQDGLTDAEGYKMCIRDRHGIDQRQLEAIVSIDLKAEERGLNELSEKWKVPFITYTSEQLKSTGEAVSYTHLDIMQLYW